MLAEAVPIVRAAKHLSAAKSHPWEAVRPRMNCVGERIKNLLQARRYAI